MEQENISDKKEISERGHGIEVVAVLSVIFLCAIISSIFGFWQSPVKDTSPELSIVNRNIKTPVIDPFAETNIQARSAYVFDVRNKKVIFAKNANQALPLASITKIMTAEVASELLDQNSIVYIDGKSLGQDGDSGLLMNEKWSFKKLMDYTLAVSSNDGAAAIATAASPNFVDKMNEKASSIGLSSMHFYNETGLDVSSFQSGANGSAADVAKLFTHILENNPQIFNATKYAKFTVSSLDNIKHVAINTDEDINKIPGIIASKTGFTNLAGGNLAVAYDAGVNYPIIAVVLGSTYDGRFTDMASLINTTNKAISLQN